MPIINQEKWDVWVAKNTDSYGGACVNVARKAMELLDEMPNDQEINCHKLISDADKDSKTGGITGFMAGYVAQMVSQCHSRGEEFRRKWNTHNQINTEGDKANESGGILNPALLNISVAK